MRDAPCAAVLDAVPGAPEPFAATGKADEPDVVGSADAVCESAPPALGTVEAESGTDGGTAEDAPAPFDFRLEQEQTKTRRNETQAITAHFFFIIDAY